MEADGIHLSEFRNIKTLMGAFGFSDGSAGEMAVQPMVQHSVCPLHTAEREPLKDLVTALAVRHAALG